MPDPDTGTPVNSPDVLQIAHLSDPHLTSLHGVAWRELANKRILGYLSWFMGRKSQHQSGILNTLLQDLQETRPDHIAVTGDLTQIGTAMECREAVHWLARLGSPDRVTVIPGNHDRYTPADWHETVGRWLPYLQDEPLMDPATLFPTLRCRASVALVGLCSAVPTPPFMATGRLGESQLQRFDTLLAGLADRNMFRVILLHHGPLPGINSFRRRLVDADDLISILKHRGADLVLHGHGHRNTSGIIGTAAVDIPVFGVASASSVATSTSRTATYNLFRITRQSRGWAVRLCFRSYNPYTGAFESGGSREIVRQQPHKS
jgi:3',5'-cyclic AMP phosphodiesterase CpdA